MGTYQTYSDVLKEFAETSCCNGLPNTQRGEPMLRRIVWYILLIGGSGMSLNIFLNVIYLGPQRYKMEADIFLFQLDQNSRADWNVVLLYKQ